ncbi:hypothetical protein DYI24_01100 [Rhodopseudomonas sp. BR0C11]|uniref:hypothetical protein n=1 Tax=Rhodopseudomonas sp. BR0C11 TaxID=2269370 RepID=UPI0013E0A4AB|nr:hypothetical protein [Rhodopseudomonas sp. BR0C11]NEV75642.1 hypothetical protein [Rhodopseudomonas sp. BR0C11]
MGKKLFNNVRHIVVTPGSGAIALGTVPATWQSFAAAGAVDGDQPPYELVDGDNRENGYLTLQDGVTTATRTVVTSTNGNSPIDLSGSAVLTCTPIAETFNNDVLSVSRDQGLSTGAKNQGLSNLGVTDLGKQIATAADAEHARSAAGISGRNLITNADFRINQRGYVSGAALAAGAYGHDRWKAGTGGGAYTFSQLVTSTQISIAASKSIRQTVEPANVRGGTYVLSWEGTATGRVGVGGAPTGNFVVSPITVTGVSAGLSLDVEFTGANAAGGSSIASNAGTLGKVQLEQGAVPTPFEFRSIASELDECMRFYQFVRAGSQDNGAAVATKGYLMSVNFPRRMRIAPQVLDYTVLAAQNVSGSSRSVTDVSEYGLTYLVAASGGPTMIDRVTITLSADL